MTRENAAMAILVTLQSPTSAMKQEAANAGVYETPIGATYPAIQILTIDELLDGKEPRIPREQATFKAEKPVVTRKSVPNRGLEPPRPRGHQLLRLACLPIPPIRPVVASSETSPVYQRPPSLPHGRAGDHVDSSTTVTVTDSVASTAQR